MIYHSTHNENFLRLILLVEKQNKPARSPYSLEIEPKIKNFKLNILDSETFFEIFHRVVRITTERTLI